MTAEEPDPAAEMAYTWDEALKPPTQVVQLWTEVGNGLDKSQTVVWKSAVESLDDANKHLATSEDARVFVEKYMGAIIGILVEQQPAKIGMHERTCVQESLALGAAIVAKDLEIQLARGGESNLLPTLSQVLNKKKAFYKGNRGTWNSNHLIGMPEVRMRNIERFRGEGGFGLLHRYLVAKMDSPAFPKLDQLHHILQAIGDSMPSRSPVAEQAAAIKTAEDDAILAAKAVMQYIENMTDDALKKIPADSLTIVQQDLQRIFDRLVATRRANTYEFYQFWRQLIFKMITSQSLPLKLYGWEQVGDLIEACGDHRPPPRAFAVSSAGAPFVNGDYNYAGEITPDGYAKPGGDVSYVHVISDAFPEHAGKKLTLFRCTMRSQQKWWFLSEADEEQPGTDRDVDYYQHKSKEHEEAYPPPAGWITCRSAGVDPPPRLAAQGVLVPEGAEFDTLEHQLAKWAIENQIVEQVLGDTTIHREVVARSTRLINFLAEMCKRDQPTDMVTDEVEPKQYCLQASHLLFAWKTCTRKADAAVSLQVYQLLVAILPQCTSELAIPLLKAVQTSLHESNEKRDYLFEVSEFCAALAAANQGDGKNPPAVVLNEEVREEVLDLLWSVLTHPGSSSLKSYDSLKRYVTHELRVEPKGSEHRERFLRSCITVLSTNAGIRDGAGFDEAQALRSVKLMHFVLAACPAQQAGRIVSDDSGGLPRLLFQELLAYLERTKSVRQGPYVKEMKQYGDALNERLRILRYVYGLSAPRVDSTDPITMSASMIEQLWNLCFSPDDRECLMVFIASASNASRPQPEFGPAPHATAPALQNESGMSAALTDEVCQSVFLGLFCSGSFQYQQLGHHAYKSFQLLFNMLRESAAPPDSKKMALDALWRVCLTVERDSVASAAMKDLLSVYVLLQTETVRPAGATEEMVTDEADEESFGKRIFECLARLKDDFSVDKQSAERSAERCLQILNAAIGQTDADGLTTKSTLSRLSMLAPGASLADAVMCLPHGMRGQACYRRVGIIAKRTQGQNQNSQGQSPGDGRIKPSTLKFTLDVHPLETLASLKNKVAVNCRCPIHAVKLVQINGRASGAGRVGGGESPSMGLNLMPEDTVVDELGVVQSCEIVFLIAERAVQNSTVVQAAPAARTTDSHDLSGVFFSENKEFADSLFAMLLDISEAFPLAETASTSSNDKEVGSTTLHKLIWDFLLALPTNASIAARVKSAQARSIVQPSSGDAMEVEPAKETWSQLLDARTFDRSVYVLLTIDANLQPAKEAFSVLPLDQRKDLEDMLVEEATLFRRAFIEAGGFGAVVRFFSSSGDEQSRQSRTRRGNAVALRILKSCLFGMAHDPSEGVEVATTPDDVGNQLLSSLTDTEGLLRSLTAMVVDDLGISSSTIMDILKFLRLLFRSQSAAQSFVALPTAERFLVILLLWDEKANSDRPTSSISTAMHVRRSAHDLVLHTSLLADHSLPWLMNAVNRADVAWENTSEYFDVLERLVSDERASARSRAASEKELRELGTIVCRKLASCPRPNTEADSLDFPTGVLCGCLKLLRALVENGGGGVLREGANLLLAELEVEKWSTELVATQYQGVLGSVNSLGPGLKPEDVALIDIMGAIFDGFLSPCGPSSVATCGDKESRRKGFDVVGAAARSCTGGEGYLALVNRISGLVVSASPSIRHRFGHFGGGTDSHRNASSTKYSGLRNQGCTCYMNSVLQQLFMMPELRKQLCDAPLPDTLRSSGARALTNGAELVGKRLAVQWDTGVSYDAIVEGFNESTGMHTVRYCPIQVATVGGSVQHQVQPEDIARLPPLLPEEFVLSEGRPGKETGVFEVVVEPTDMETESTPSEVTNDAGKIKESEDESSSRHLLEEVQRTFIHLEEGSRGRCFDPRALVEACACLKLEFDVWQQNDASEFATKLLDRLEISLKKWAPESFKYVDHTFGLKQTTQKICKECKLKTNREEKLLSIDCQIRGKNDIHEALADMTEAQIMEGSNKVNCDRCKKKTDTIIRTAISTLPNLLVLSLKRFDLDFTTFETVKLNNRCAFGHTLDMKQYTLEGLEAMERAAADQEGDPAPMDTEEGLDQETSKPLLNDEDYEYRLVGVLVHAGVAQGGHYYSFISDRSSNQSEAKWFRFDDDDVTPFDPALIESECFGGKVKKETKWPNGQVHTVEQEQFANALMLFYEKVTPASVPLESEDDQKKEKAENSESKAAEEKVQALENIETATGYDVFEPDVRLSNTTHQWQSFLFDSEFQTFLRGLLGICRLPSNDQDPPVALADETWRSPLVEMLLTVFFDVMMYSSDCSFLNDWSRMLEDVLMSNADLSLAFVHKLARKTKEVSANWLRTFLLECPDGAIRAASVRIFSAAIRSHLLSGGEQNAIVAWTLAWRQQVSERPVDQSALTDEPNPMPLALEGKWAHLEDVSKLDTGGASSIGVILSFVNVLLEVMPRCWKFSTELCVFVRSLASMNAGERLGILREPMIECLIPARLIALIVRERIPGAIRGAFPGASVALEVAQTQVRAESTPSANVMSMSGSQVGGASDLNSSRGPTVTDYMVMLEAIACLAGLPGVVQELLIRDSEDVLRGRQRFLLSEKAMKALNVVFDEVRTPGAPGMGQREIESYLHRCGVDTGTVSTQKILDMLSKYPTTTGGNGSKAGTYLSLEGFIAYYRDCVQSNDIRLRNDLHTFGFRPDLTRRSRESRIFVVGERESQRLPVESVAIDVAETLGEKPMNIGSLAKFALLASVPFYSLAYSVSEPLMEYLVAAGSYRSESEGLINRTLQMILTTPNDWSGNESVSGYTVILQTIAATPGDSQSKLIALIMESSVKAARNTEYGAGLLQVLRALHRMRQTQHYSNDVHWTFGRYMNILKELHSMYPIFKWMNDNRSSWAFIERDLLDSRSVVTLQGQARGDYAARDADPTLPLEHNTHSDSDMAGTNDSEDDDEDSHFDHTEGGGNTANDGPYQIIIRGAGNAAVNGVYHQDGYFETTCRYVMEGKWNGSRHKFYIFQCNVSNNTKHWYISIVPPNQSPGTSSDIDFYTAPVSADCERVPPTTGWIKANEGREQPPTLEYRTKPVVEEEPEENHLP